MSRDRDKEREQRRKWRADNPEKVAAQKRRWRARNLERLRQRDREYREERRDQIAERDRRYRAVKGALIDARTKRWRENNPERAAQNLVRSELRRSLRMEPPGDIVETAALVRLVKRAVRETK
jgi:hypothetical protein